MTRLTRLLLLTLALPLPLPGLAQTGAAGPENLVTDGVPPITARIADAARRYGEFRAADFWDWHPTRLEMIIGTRFGDAPQLHRVAFPGGARAQLTFFPDPVSGASYQPVSGRYIVFAKDIGGAEFFQKYRYDVATGAITLLTDGKSRNVGGAWSHRGDRYAYMSTRRNGRDLDLWVMDPSDAASGRKTLLTPKQPGDSVAYGGAQFSRDAKGVYVTTDRGSEFQRLAYLDLATGQYRFLTSAIPWDVDE